MITDNSNPLNAISISYILIKIIAHVMQLTILDSTKRNNVTF